MLKKSAFKQASLSLREFLEKFQRERDFSGFSRKWAEPFEKFKISVKEMPKVVRHHPFVKKSLLEIETMERDLKHYFSEKWENSSPEFKKRVAGLQAQSQRMNLLLGELEANPYIQKFMRGETVLSSHKTLQWRRKLVHVSLGLIFLYIFVYSGWSKFWIWSIAGPFIIFTFTMEALRHRYSKVNQRVLKIFGPIMRETETTSINSAVFYVFAMVVVYFIFPIEVAALTLLFIAVGDPFAGIVGVLWGKRKISAHATWEGTFACFAACGSLAALCASVLFQNTLSGFSLIVFSVLSGIVGATAEASFKKLDDNLVMPLLSAPPLWILMKLFSIL